MVGAWRSWLGHHIIASFMALKSFETHQHGFVLQMIWLSSTLLNTSASLSDTIP